MQGGGGGGGYLRGMLIYHSSLLGASGISLTRPGLLRLPANSGLEMRTRTRARGMPRRTGEDFSVSQPAKMDLSGMHHQAGSPLFSQLPLEIRTLIFEDALAPYDDLAKPYAKDREYCRPGQRYHPRTDVALLQTCKRIFQETRLKPVAQTTHTFWLFRGPWRSMRTGKCGMYHFPNWQRSLSEEQRAAVRRVHIYAQQFALEGLGSRRNDLFPLDFAANHLRITLTNADWWSWESPPASSDRLGICPWRPGRTSHQAMLVEPSDMPLEKMRQQMGPGTWGWQVRHVRGLQTLQMEFEVDARKLEQLDAVLARAKHWVFPMEDGSQTVLRQTGSVEHFEWEGFSDTKDDSIPILNQTGRSLSDRHIQRTFRVALMTWRSFKA